MVHARALLTNASDTGVTDYIEADLREPDKILQEAVRTLDFSQPVALMLVAVLHFITEDEDPCGIVARLVDTLAPGSYLVMSHATGDYLDAKTLAGFTAGPAAISFRTREQFGRFFDGLEPVPPGVVSAAEWRAEDEPQPRLTAADTATYCAVAQIP